MTNKTMEQTKQGHVHTAPKQGLFIFRRVLRAVWIAAVAALFSGAVLLYGVQPLGVALVCSAGRLWMLPATCGAVTALLLGRYGEAGGLYAGALLLSFGIRYAVSRFLCATPSRTGSREIGFGGAKGRGKRYLYDGTDTDTPYTDDAFETATASVLPKPLRRLATGLIPPGVFSETRILRIGISVLCACPIAAGLCLTDAGAVTAACAAVFTLCSVPAFTYLFSAISDAGADEEGVTPAQKEAGIGAFCFALTASVGGVIFLGFSLKMICAHTLTLLIAKKSGYLRGGLSGLVCGFACDALYAPAYALIGAIFGIFGNLYLLPATLLSLCAGAGYAVYVGEFAAIRSVLPEMIAVSAALYPLFRYLPLFFAEHPLGKRIADALGAVLSDTGGGARDAHFHALVRAGGESDETVTPQQLGIPGYAEQLDALSGILSGLSATFCHLSDRQKKPGLYEIRGCCESIADRYCIGCANHTHCWEESFSETADAMGRITLCIHRRGRAEHPTAFSPLDKTCPHIGSMLAEMNEAAATLCEEKILRDKTEVAAEDYAGMAKLLRASAEEASHAADRDPVLSGRLGRAIRHIGFSARDVSVYGARRKTVVARGIHLGGTHHGDGETLTPLDSAVMLGTEEVREAFSALAGVRYRTPEYSLAAGGEEVCMTMHAEPCIALSSGCWGEKKAGEEITGDILTVFANRADYYYALLCDGMGSGREASVTAQIAALFLEKLLSVSCAKGAALNLLNGYLRARHGECSATVDLCEIDMITSEAHFVKCGAAASYLLRGDSMFRIASSTMPLGILREVTAEETSFALEVGDLLLFFSDGVCGECEDASWISSEVECAKENYAREYARLCSRTHALERDGGSDGTVVKGENLGNLYDYVARALGESAKARVGRQDDMTVIVVAVEGRG